MKDRIIILFIGFFGIWVLLLSRAASLQFLPNERLEQLRQRQFQTQVVLPARRGAILDIHGRGLAISQPAYGLYADPKKIQNRKSVAKKLAKALGYADFGVIYDKIKDKEKRFVWLARQLGQENVSKIKDLEIEGIGFIEDWKRVYPNDNLMGPLLGFLGVDGQALEGIELQFDEILRGNKKKLRARRDARGRPLMSDGLLFAENEDGQDIELTIDSELQYLLESELTAALKEFEAAGAIGVVLDARTSAIRAMASMPQSDPNFASTTSASLKRNRAITDSFEPGSTLKSFVVASALRNQSIKANTKFYCEQGSFKIADRVIKEADSHHHFGWLSVSEILSFSSNIGTAKIALQSGSEKVRQGLLDFGFGSRLGVDLPGEVKGQLLPLPWNSHLLANVSFGQGMASTALQIANAYAAIANGGVLRTPYILNAVLNNTSGEGKIVSKYTEPKDIRRVLSVDEAAQMRALLNSVTAPGGTGEKAKVDGYIVAGKTGTAQKVNPKGRGYLTGQYISSFAGFLPANDPRFVIYIAVDQPQKAYYGSQVAAPIFSRVGGYAVRKEGLAPTSNKSNFLITNSERILKGERAIEKIEKEVAISGSTVLDKVPTLKSLSLREVMQNLQGQKLDVKLIGRGRVTEVVPAEGSAIPEDRKINIYFE